MAQLIAEKNVVLKSGEGNSYWMLGGLYTVKAAADDTGGALTVMEMTIPVGGGPPPHTHDGTESVRVLEGRARYHRDGETFEAGPGAFLHFPKGTLETFEPLETLHVYVVYTPGGVDGFFAEAGVPATSNQLPPPSDEPPDIARMVALAARYGVEMKAPNA